MKKIKYLNFYLIACHLCRHFPFRMVSDEFYIKLFYRAYQGEKLNLENPRSFNEKIQWLKLYDRNPFYVSLSDKYLVRQYVKEVIGPDYLIPLLGTWKNADDINFSLLPNEFVLKCNHDSGSVIICKNKYDLNFSKTKKQLNKSLKYQYFWKSREYNYKYIDRCIIAEELLIGDGDEAVKDYKYFCFNGKPMFVQVDINRFSNHIRNYYDMEWNFIDVEYGCPNDPSILIEKPKQHDEMATLAGMLAINIPHVRVDFYISNDRVYFGEMTFHHGGGAMLVSPKAYDYLWGDYLELPLAK